MKIKFFVTGAVFLVTSVLMMQLVYAQFTVAFYDNDEDFSGEMPTYSSLISDDEFFEEVVPQIHMVLFNLNGGMDQHGNEQVYVAVTAGSVIPVDQRVTPTLAGHTFTGWSTVGGQAFNVATDSINSDLTLVAQFVVHIPSLQPALPTPAPLVVPGSQPDHVPLVMDLVPGHWATDYIQQVLNAGVFTLTSPNHFGLEMNMTREMFARAIFNLEGAQNVFQTPQFNDVSPGQPYFDAVQWASAMGIVQGIAPGQFDPHGEITREQIAVLLHRYAEIFGITLVPQETMIFQITFTDQNDISTWAAEAVWAVRQLGLLAGHPDGRFDPQATATRAEVAAIFARVMANR